MYTLHDALRAKISHLVQPIKLPSLRGARIHCESLSIAVSDDRTPSDVEYRKVLSIEKCSNISNFDKFELRDGGATARRREGN